MFLLRHIGNNVRRLVPFGRPLTTQVRPLTDLKVDKDGIAIVTMQRAPVNSLNLDLLQDISKSLDEVVKSKARAMILTSASPTVFSAGVDVTEMYKPDVKRIETLCSTMQDVWLKIFGSPIITATAINGHAPAGGCLLAMSCEYRTMVTGRFSIGVNETAVGLIAPSWFMDTVCHSIPIRQAEIMFTLGKLFSPEEALKVGIIDAIASDKDDALAKCKSFVQTFNNVSPIARSFTKLKVREAVIKKFQENRIRDVQEFVEYIQRPAVQERLEMFMKSIKKKDITALK